MRAFLLVLAASGCARTGVPDAVRADPQADAAVSVPSTSVPSTSVAPTTDASDATSAPTPAPSYASVTAGESATHVCEPVVRCGVWSGCRWLRRIDATHARDDGTGVVYVRRHDCSPADAGPGGCALFCSAPDAGPPCVDGLHPEVEACKGTAPPRPTTARCLLGDGVCGSLL